MQDPRWDVLSYWNPAKVLRGLDRLFDSVGLRRFRHPGDLLLSRQVRQIAEDRRCALFLFGAGQVLRRRILFAPCECRDYDYVGAYEINGRVYRFPIQLKQLVPNRLNASTDLQREVAKLKKYGTSPDLVVAIHINRQIHLQPQLLDLSGVKVKELWLFGQFGARKRTWLLIGNLMSAPRAYFFDLLLT
jgi:hypothetical protein